MKHSLSFRTFFLFALLISTTVISNQTFADISIGYYGGHYGHGYKYGHKHNYKYGYGHYKHYEHYGYKRYKRHYYPSYYYYPKRYSYYRYPYKYRSYKYYRPYNYYPHSYSYNNYSRFYSLKKRAYNYSNDAWTKLYNGQARNALTQFGNEVQSYPNAGLPKAGYALAAASTGNLDRGIWAMRRAFQYDPDSLQQLTKDTRLTHTLNNLISKYEYQLHHSGQHQDEAFMVAALNYLKGNHAAAKAAANRAARDGDRSRSFRNLQYLLAAN